MGSTIRRVGLVAAIIVFALMHVVLSPLPFAALGWTLTSETGYSHRVHEVMFGTVFVISFIGLIRLLRRRSGGAPAAWWQVAIPLWTLVVATVVVDRTFDPVVAIFLLFPLLILALHPQWRTILRPALRPDRLLLALAVVLAVPALAFAFAEVRIGIEATPLAQQVEEQLSDDATDEEWVAALDAVSETPEERELVEHAFHWSAMAGLAVGLAGLALVAALGLAGGGLTGVVAAAAVAYYGVASLATPGDASAALPVVAIAVVAWAVAFGVRSWQVTRERNPDLGGTSPAATSA